MMEVDARMRMRVHARLEELMGAEMADAVMEMFPPAGWRGVATRDDVERVAAELRGEIAEVRGEIAEVRGEVAGVRGELLAEIRGSALRLLLAHVASVVAIVGVVLVA